MEAAGLPPTNLHAVRGFADRHLRRPEDPMDYQNRRVSIIVMFQEKGPLRPGAGPPLPEAALRQQPPPPPGQETPKDAGLRQEIQEKLKPLQVRTRQGW
jgi:hypothetical protein